MSLLLLSLGALVTGVAASCVCTGRYAIRKLKKIKQPVIAAAEEWIVDLQEMMQELKDFDQQLGDTDELKKNRQQTERDIRKARGEKEPPATVTQSHGPSATRSRFDLPKHSSENTIKAVLECWSAEIRKRGFMPPQVSYYKDFESHSVVFAVSGKRITVPLDYRSEDPLAFAERIIEALTEVTPVPIIERASPSIELQPADPFFGAVIIRPEACYRLLK